MTTDKAKRETTFVGSLEIEGFMMPDGSYRMSQAQAAECIGMNAMSTSRFLQSKAFKALRGEGYTDHTFEQIAVETAGEFRGETRINAVPLDVVMLFWLYQCSRGNKPALSLLAALATETLERRFDQAFGVERTNDEYNQRLAKRLERTEQQLSLLGEAYASDDLLREENERLRQQLRNEGIEPEL